MARKTRKHKRSTDLPGTIYLNKNRYWWKVQLPGEAKAKSRPLRSLGSKYATTDYGAAVEVASNIWQEAIYRQTDDSNIESSENVAFGFKFSKSGNIVKCPS